MTISTVEGIRVLNRLHAMWGKIECLYIAERNYVWLESKCESCTIAEWYDYDDEE